MAITKMKPVHSHLKYIIGYVSNIDKTFNPSFSDVLHEITYIGNDMKTEQRLFVAGINCFPDTAYQAMLDSYKKSDKPMPVLAYHAIQSFRPGEVSAKTAHEIGVKLASELWGDKFVALVATHLNKAHYHNHFLLCSTSFKDGSRYHACTATYWDMRNASDRLCREYGLSVTPRKNCGSMDYNEAIAEKENKPTYSSLMRADIDIAISQSLVMPEFFKAMERLGYELKHGKYLAVRGRGSQRFRRVKTLGENYSEEAIYRRIMENLNRVMPPRPKYEHLGIRRLRGTFKPHSRLKGLRALYYHYLYRMCILPQQKKIGQRASPLLREDIIKLNKLTVQRDFLTRHKLDTPEQLTSFKSEAQKQLGFLEAARGEVRQKLRRKNDAETTEMLRSEISEITSQMRTLRREIKLCDNVAEQSRRMKEKLKIIAEVEKERSEQKQKKKYGRGKNR